VIKLKHLIDEGLSDIVYHYTSVLNLKNIIRDNEFRASIALGSEPDLNINGKKFYYMSTTRSKGTGYNIGQVCLVLDGRKLHQRYKGLPVDYWQPSKDPDYYASPEQFIKHAFRSEQEDRIILDKPVIENALSYIKEIHIYIDADYPDTQLKRLEYISNNIPSHIKLYFYNNEKYFKTQAKNKSVDVTASMFRDNGVEVDDYQEIMYAQSTIEQNTKRVLDRIGTVITILSYNDDNNFKKIVYSFKESYSGDEYAIVYKMIRDRIEKDIQRYNLWEKYGYDEHKLYDFYTILMNDIHTYRTYHIPVIKSILYLLAQDLKIHKCKNMKEYLNFKFGTSYTFD